MSQDTTAGPVPTPGDDPDVPADMLALAQALGPSIVPQFNTTTERNTQYAISPFRMCWVAGVLQQRRGSAWYAVGGNGWGGADITSSVQMGIPTSSSGDPKWTVVSFPTTGGYFDGDSDAFGLSSASNGFVVPAGRYWAKGFLKWAASSSGGRRLCAVGPSTAGVNGPGNRVRGGEANWPSPLETEVDCNGEFTMAAAGIISLYAYQDAGGPIAVTDRVLEIRRVG